VYGWVADHAGCGYYRVKLPLSTLPKDSWDATYATVLPSHYRDDADVVVGQRIVKEATSGLWRDVCRNPNILAVYEVDDDLLNIDATSIGHEYYSQGEVRNNFRRNIEMADVVTTSTPYLADLLAQWNPRVVLVPNYVPALALQLPRRPADDITMIGYTSSATHDMDFALVHGQLKRVLARTPDTVLVNLVGAAYPGLPADRVLHTSWIHRVPDYLAHVARFDIGIAPLKPHLFNRSKSHLKALEYAALGIPAVVSASEAYDGFVDHSITGWIIKHEHEWASTLGALIREPALRQLMGAAARERAAAWTIEGNIGRWELALRGEV
jgi:glycosyltransferase involved in cell wall biosynthesis